MGVSLAAQRYSPRLYSHSLLGAIVWSAIVAAGFLLLAGRDSPRGRAAAATTLGAAVFSHFLLDVPVHTPDLPLGPGAGSPKIGLGLWNHRLAGIAGELAVLIAGGVLSCAQRAPAAAARPWRPRPSVWHS